MKLRQFHRIPDFFFLSFDLSFHKLVRFSCMKYFYPVVTFSRYLWVAVTSVCDYAILCRNLDIFVVNLPGDLNYKQGDLPQMNSLIHCCGFERARG